MRSVITSQGSRVDYSSAALTRNVPASSAQMTGGHRVHAVAGTGFGGSEASTNAVDRRERNQAQRLPSPRQPKLVNEATDKETCPPAGSAGQRPGWCLARGWRRRLLWCGLRVVLLLPYRRPLLRFGVSKCGAACDFGTGTVVDPVGGRRGRTAGLFGCPGRGEGAMRERRRLVGVRWVAGDAVVADGGRGDGIVGVGYPWRVRLAGVRCGRGCGRPWPW